MLVGPHVFHLTNMICRIVVFYYKDCRNKNDRQVCMSELFFLIEFWFKANPYGTNILAETETEIGPLRYENLDENRKILVGRLECRFPDGNEIHSRRLHQSNGNLFEHVKFYILPTFYTLIGWTLIKMRLNFNW